MSTPNTEVETSGSSLDRLLDSIVKLTLIAQRMKEYIDSLNGKVAPQDTEQVKQELIQTQRVIESSFVNLKVLRKETFALPKQTPNE